MIIKGIKAVASWRKDAKKHYNANGGDVEKATEAYRAELKTKAIDPMTIMVLIQLAIKIWAWAKQNGYLTSMPVDERLPSEPSTDDLMAGIEHPEQN